MQLPTKKKTAGTALAGAWWFCGEISQALEHWETLTGLLRRLGFIQKDGVMNIPAFTNSWWFPYITSTSAIVIIALIWRKELAPILARESLWPDWHFWARFFPFFYKKEKAIEGAHKLRDLIERGRFIANPQNIRHDPNTERVEWYNLGCLLLAEYYPLQLARFQSLHGKDWETRGHRVVLKEEIEWLEKLLDANAMR